MAGNDPYGMVIGGAAAYVLLELRKLGADGLAGVPLASVVGRQIRNNNHRSAANKLHREGFVVIDPQGRAGNGKPKTIRTTGKDVAGGFTVSNPTAPGGTYERPPPTFSPVGRVLHTEVAPPPVVLNLPTMGLPGVYPYRAVNPSTVADATGLSVAVVPDAEAVANALNERMRYGVSLGAPRMGYGYRKPGPQPQVSP